MASRKKQVLPRDQTGLYPVPPDPVPTNPDDLLGLMDEASSFAGRGQGVGAPAYDHGVRVFSQLNAHYQARIARDLGKAHKALKIATWWLAAVTVALGVVEAWKLIGHQASGGGLRDARWGRSRAGGDPAC